MRDPFLTRTTYGALALTLAASAAAAAAGAGRAALGIAVGAAWMYLNLVTLFHVVGASWGPRDARSTRRLSWLLVLKFPVLYLAGYFILVLRAFPVESLAAGLTLALAPFAVLGLQRTSDSAAGKEVR